MITDDAIGETFAASAKSFCALIDRRATLSEWEFMREVTERLADLYHSGLLLIRLDADTDAFDLLTKRPSNDEWHVVYKELEDKFTDRGVYWEVFDPRTKTEPLSTTLADDLADIYLEIKIGLDPFYAGRKEESICHWRVSFVIHWGDHLVDALRFLHRIIAAHVIDEL